jgi:hypothetical protein
MMTRSAPLRFEEATNADGVWRLVVRSSDGVVGHIFRTVGEYGYFAIDASTVTFRDSNLERSRSGSSLAGDEVRRPWPTPIRP